MSLDARYIIASDLQSLFRDKTTGLPLRNGVIYFWADQARTIPKSVYKITGTPPNYNYVDLGSIIHLTSIGTISDNMSDDIILYYLPYDANHNVELYFVQVYSEGGISSGVLQFTREGWPNFSASTAGQFLENFVPDGQFLIHTDIPAIPDVPTSQPGKITEPITQLAQGGWTFERPNTSTATDIVTFTSFGGAVANPTANPKFAVTIANQIPNAGDTFKDLRLKFPDVNKFASTTQQYTYAFSGLSNNSGAITVQLILIKNFGTGGDPTTETPIGFLTIPTSYEVIQASFVFGTNIGTSIGTDGDDYLQLAIRFPLSSSFSASFTDFILTPNAVTVTDFPPTPNGDYLIKSLVGSSQLPNYDASSLYLPWHLTLSGMVFDDGCIGDVVTESQVSVYVDSLHPTTNRMLADGSQYERLAYSTLGIPFNRLFQKYWNSTLNVPIYGTGDDYFIALAGPSFTSLVDEVRIVNNTLGTVADTADGSVPTGFTFATIHTGNAGYNCVSYQNTGATFYIIDTEIGESSAPTAGTSGFAVSAILGSIATTQIVAVTALAAAGLEHLYFTFATINLGAPLPVYVWFKVDGIGTDPAPGGSGIEVDLSSSDSAITVCQKVSAAINSFQISTVLALAGSAVPPGSFFTLSSTTQDFYVWYTVNGTGTDPMPTGRTAIPVAVLSADTNAQVAIKTQIAINQKFFRVPDYRGYFLRTIDPSSAVDDGIRLALTPGILQGAIGTLQLSQNRYFEPTAVTTLGGTDDILQGNGGGVGDISAGTDYGYATITATTVVSSDGDTQSQPVNISVNRAILY
jgi:hypothetical protein